MNKSAAFCFGLIASGFGLDVLAHGGHGVSAPASYAHYLIEPLHVLSVFAPLAVVGAAVWLLRRKAG
jgi:cytochrome c oxidase assembly factor CtaG